MAKSSGCTIYGGLGRLLWLFRWVFVSTCPHSHSTALRLYSIPFVYFSHPENCHPAHNNFCTFSSRFRFYRFWFSRSQQLSPSCCYTTSQLHSLQLKSQICIWKQMWWTLTGTFELGILCSSCLPEPPSLSFWTVSAPHKDSLWAGRPLLFQMPFFSKSWSHQTSTAYQLIWNLLPW